MEAELSAQDIILYRRMARAKMPAKAKAKSWLKGISTWFGGDEVHQEEVRVPEHGYRHCCVLIHPNVATPVLTAMCCFLFFLFSKRDIKDAKSEFLKMLAKDEEYEAPKSDSYVGTVMKLAMDRFTFSLANDKEDGSPHEVRRSSCGKLNFPPPIMAHLFSSRHVHLDCAILCRGRHSRGPPAPGREGV